MTHDRYFLDNVAGWILELDRGQGIPYKGNYTSGWSRRKRGWRSRRRSNPRGRKRWRMNWNGCARVPPPAWPRARPDSPLTRKWSRRIQRRKRRKSRSSFRPARGSGATVIDAVNLSKAFGDHVLFENLIFSLPPNGIVGIIGPNGAGKTTLFRIITGLEKPDSGEIKLGDAVKLAYVEQSRDEPAATTGRSGRRWATAKKRSRSAGRGPWSTPGHTRPALPSPAPTSRKSWRPLRRRTQPRPPGRACSHGRQRPASRRTDQRSRHQHHPRLEEGLENFAGCAVIISHDRWFLDRIATHILAFEGDSQVVFFEGNYQEYERNKKQRLGRRRRSTASHQVSKVDQVATELPRRTRKGEAPAQPRAYVAAHRAESCPKRIRCLRAHLAMACRVVG